MNNQEILPEPVPHGNEQLVKHAESDSEYDEKEDSKKVETQPAAVTGGAVISSMNVSAAQGQVGGAVQDDSSSTVSSQSSAPLASAQLSADDLDLIEKEWVKKAKEIVEATQNDPHVQSDELSKVKADYIKKRYGKDVRVKES